MKTLTQLKYLAAYYAYHHREPQDFDECGGVAQFIDDVANAILEAMPTADLETIRRFMVDGNVNDWIALGKVIEEVLEPERDEDEHPVDRAAEEHEYKFGDWRL